MTDVPSTDPVPEAPSLGEDIAPQVFADADAYRAWKAQLDAENRAKAAGLNVDEREVEIAVAMPDDYLPPGWPQ